MKLYFKYFTTQIKSNMTYRASTLFASLGQLLGTITTLIGIYLLFGKFEHLSDYSFKHILLTYAIVIFVFSFDEMIFRGFDEFDKLVSTGEMDRLLLRPRNLVLQICGYKIEPMKLGRVLFGLTLIIFACINLGIEWTFLKVLIVIEMIISGIITFFGVYLFTASITIFTINRAEFINIFTDGGRELCYYPLDIFKKFISRLFTFIIPFATFNYMPLRFLLGFSDASVWNIIYPLISIVFCIIGYFVFNLCMRKYKSCGWFINLQSLSLVI